MMRSATYQNYFLVLLTAIATFNCTDGLALGLAFQGIQAEFGLSDTELGFLGGIAFALFYSVLGLPIARWADRGNRVGIICLSVALWSVAVALCGVAGSFLQLLLIRVFVGVGEAGCNPSALSLIADCFARAERPRATVIYGLANVLCVIPGYLGAGWLNELYGWRVTFMALGLPGLVLAPLAWFTMREPRLQAPVAAEPTMSAAVTAVPSLPLVVRTLWESRTFRHLLLCNSIQLFFGYGQGQWYAPFFGRTYGLTAGKIGTALTIACGLGAVIGTYLLSQWTSRYAVKDERIQLRGTAFAIAMAGIFMMGVYLVPNALVAFVLVGLQVMFSTSIYGPVWATIQTLVPRRMTAVAFALVFFCANLFGIGLGPLAVGMLSDALRPLGSEPLRYALLIFSAGYFWAAWHAWCASRTVTRDLQVATSRDEIGSQSAQDGALEPA